MAKTFISARWLLVGLLGLALWLTPGATYGQSRELIDAANRAGTLYGQGRYEEALPFAKKVVGLGEQEFGANHPTFAAFLNNLAALYQAQARYAEAEPQLIRPPIAWDEDEDEDDVPPTYDPPTLRLVVKSIAVLDVQSVQYDYNRRAVSRYRSTKGEA